VRRILLVDDHALVRRGLCSLLEAEADFTVCGEAAEAPRALSLVLALGPDAVIADISLRGSDGLELIKAIRAQSDALPILVVSVHDETLYAERVLRAGGNGYVMKQDAAEDVVAGLRAVLEGEVYVSEAVRQQIVRRVRGRPPANGEPPVARLTDRELEVFRLIGRGHDTRRIAEELHLSVKTIETYRANIKRKLGIRNAPNLVRQAVMWAEEDGGD
jgi:DNA-binding NarL/FixJ family response regulator